MMSSSDHQVSKEGTRLADVPKTPRTGLWNSYYCQPAYNRQVYGDDTTVRLGVSFLPFPEVLTIEDWGCGYGGAKLYIDPRQEYTGVDGSCSRFADKIVDLETYRNAPDAVFIRHVLEHNPNWSVVLDNAVSSFQKRMVLILFSPYQDVTGPIREYPNWGGTGVSMWDIGFRRDDIISRFGDARWSSAENLSTNTGYGVEHVFFLQR